MPVSSRHPQSASRPGLVDHLSPGGDGIGHAQARALPAHSLFHSLSEDEFALGAFQAEPYTCVSIGGQNSQHVRVMLEPSAMPAQEPEHEAHHLPLRAERAQQHSFIFGYRFQEV